LYKNHQDRIAWVKCIGLDNATPNQIKTDLTKALDDNSADLAFITLGVLLKHGIIVCTCVPAHCVPALHDLRLILHCRATNSKQILRAQFSSWQHT